MNTADEEILPVVDEFDRLVGSAPRREVHRLGLRHRAVHVLVFNSAGEVFLQKRSMSKDCFPGAWDSSASGHVGSGEEYDACAMRELAEELALELKGCPERLFQLAACPETGQEFVWVYRCAAEGPFVCPPEEIECGGWFATAAVSRWIENRPGEFASAFKFLWQRLHG